MILLNDDEIIKGINDGGLAGGGVLTGLSAAGRKEHLGVAKAQLKRVWELVEKKIATLNQRGKELEELRAPIIRKLDGGWTEGEDRFMGDSLHEIYTSIPYAIQAFVEFEQAILKELK